MSPIYCRGIRVLFVLLCCLGATLAQAQPFQFVALGDLPYGAPDTAYAPYRQLIGGINKLAPSFSVHIGDIKSGSTRCSDEEFAAQRAHFGLFEGAVVYTPGDNEWTDCHRANNGGYDPIERLQALRTLFFTPGQSLGQKPLAVQNQSTLMPAYGKFVENQRWLFGEVLFVTLHIIGSNNNFEVRDARAVAEFMERDRANVEWIKAAFEQAQRAGVKALVFTMQADVFESKSDIDPFPGYSGFRTSIGETLLPLTARSKLPVLLIHGDSHNFRFDQPFRFDRKPLKTLTRLIVPGESDVRAVQVSIETSLKNPFGVRIVEPD